MKSRKCIFIIMILFCLSLSAFAQEVLKSTIDDQQSVEVTVYNSNLGLVKDIRSIALAQGEGELRFMDVAAYIMPETVRAESLNAPDAMMVLEQNYEYDLLNEKKLLDKYVGKDIKIVDYNPYQDKKEIIDAILLSNNEGQIYKIDDEIYLGYTGRKVLPEIPENLIAKPTLMWLYQNQRKKPHEIQVTYLTKNINWKADYVIALNENDTQAGLNGWVTLDNRSGTTYKDAQLKLIAGDVHRAEIPRRKSMRMEGGFDEMAVGAPQFAEQAFFEYHIYNLQRKTTIRDKQTKQVNLLEGEGIQIAKELVVQGGNHYFLNRHSPDDKKVPVEVFIKFKNSEENNLGMPLPAGVMRLYKEDSESSLQFIGEDRIQHTPKNEEIKLKVGKAFDVVVERVQTDYKRIGGRGNYVYETAWEIKIRNHKEEDVQVKLLETLPYFWRVLETSHEYQKKDAFRIQFDVPVEKDGEAVVTYRIRVNESQPSEYR